MKFLNAQGCEFGRRLHGVHRDETCTYVVTNFYSEGDLFSWCQSGLAPGLEREIVVHRLAVQIMKSAKQLHDFGISHRDLSLENILLDKVDGANTEVPAVHIVDFGMATTERNVRNAVRGKASYQAPELHGDEEVDAFLADSFSLGVALYAGILKDYPWLSTRPGGCSCFDYVRKHSFREFVSRRKLRSSGQRIVQVLSDPLLRLLEGLLAPDPSKRLTLGEATFSGERRSVWDEPWVRDGPCAG
jgi:serine/threonine protein kinase